MRLHFFNKLLFRKKFYLKDYIEIFFNNYELGLIYWIFIKKNYVNCTFKTSRDTRVVAIKMFALLRAVIQ